MENELERYELQSGSSSRSRTPLVQTRVSAESEVLEHHYDLRSRSRERSCTPGEMSNARTSGLRNFPGSSGKTQDQSMETIMERKEEVNESETTSENQKKKLENSCLVAAKRAERRSERQKAKRQIFANGQSGSSEDTFGQRSEKKHKITYPHRTITSDYSSEEGEREDVGTGSGSSAHEIYKQAGDWWNVFPKTDYTYSEKSQCRYEIAPGVLAMPNMSRRSIHSDAECSNRFSHDPSESGIYETADIEEDEESSAQNCTSVDEFHESSLPSSRISNSDARSRIEYSKTHVEQHRCHREAIYAPPGSCTNPRARQQSLRSDSPVKCIDSRKYAVASTVDSDTELDEAVLSISRKSNEKWKVTRQFMRFTAMIVLWFSKLLQFLRLKTVRRREYHTGYAEYQRYDTRWYNTVWQYVDRFLQYVYLFMVKVFFFDSWLLSRVSTIRGWMQQRSPKILWIALLPLLLFTGCRALPYLSASLPSTKAITTLTFIETPRAPDHRSFFKEKPFEDVADFKSLAEQLNSRLSRLEDRTLEQTDRFTNISEAVDQLKESDSIWVKLYQNKLLRLEKRLEEDKLDNVYGHEIESIKLQFESLKELYSELKSCCDSHANPMITNEGLEKRVEMVLAAYIGGGGGGASASNKDTIKVTKNLAVAGDEKYSHTETPRDDSTRNSGNVLTETRVREIVGDAIKLYDADKTGRVDYGLESAGGQIISTRCTQRYDIKTRAFKLLAFTLYHENNNPRTVIQGNPIQPGACWAFQGFPGYLLIKLRSSIYVTGFTVEHASKSILPNGEMKSAPRKFNVWGFVDENDPVPVMFGDYEFQATDDNLQYFPVQNTMIETPYEYVELRVHSNHGQLEYTCLYRFRVHGRPVLS